MHAALGSAGDVAALTALNGARPMHSDAPMSETVDPNLPQPWSRVSAWTRRAKIAVKATQRLVRWAMEPEAFAGPPHGTVPDAKTLSATRISLRSTNATHPLFEEGKQHNVRLAAPAFDGLLISPERPFSFWRALGRVTARRGYRHGMELAGGCIVPAIGGGLCLVSRALFQAALYSGFDVLERHGHSLAAVEPPPGVVFGLDATVLWPYVDLRFAPRRGRAVLKVEVRGGALLVRVQATEPLESRLVFEAIDDRTTHEGAERIRRNRILRHWHDHGDRRWRTDEVAVNRTRLLTETHRQRSCLTCNETSCHARVVVPK